MIKRDICIKLFFQDYPSKHMTSAAILVRSISDSINMLNNILDPRLYSALGYFYLFYFYSVCEYRDQPWFSVFKHSIDHEEGV